MKVLRKGWVWLLVMVCGVAVVVLRMDWSGGAAAGEAASQPRERAIEYAEGRQIATLSWAQIDESSGLACSRNQRGVFYTHNDSGGMAGFFAFDSHGEHLGVFRVPKARNVDWEDMASFRMDGRSWLLFGDIGDNSCRRRTSTLYLVAEPELVIEKRRMRGRTAALAGTIRFRYEDGPHDCEALGVDVAARVVLLVTKEPKRAVYQLPLEPTDAAEVRIARPIAKIAVSWVTGMDISPDGRRAVVLTYGDALEYCREGEQDWSAAFARHPRRIRLPSRAQGEAVCYGPDGRTLYLTSEKRPAPLIEVVPRDPDGSHAEKPAADSDTGQDTSPNRR